MERLKAEHFLNSKPGNGFSFDNRNPKEEAYKNVAEGLKKVVYEILK